MNKRNIFASLVIAAIVCFTSTAPVFAADVDGFDAIQEESSTVSEDSDYQNGPMRRSSNSRDYIIPGGKGRLTSNAWRTTFHRWSGDTYQWDYQVSAVYSGNYHVKSIKTIWRGSASLRNSASIDLGISGSSVSAGGGSSWQYVTTVSKSWENNNGAKEASYRSNMVVSPRRDYRSSTISIINTARVELEGDWKPYMITSSC